MLSSYLDDGQSMGILYRTIITMEKIEIKLFDIENQTILDQRDCSITLYDDRLIYILDIDIDEPKNREDPMLGTVEESWFGHHTIKKSMITEVSVNLNAADSYSVKIYDNGSAAGSIKVLFKTKSEAFEVRDKIVNWWLGPIISE